ncbi:MAG TPA: hypothetical protein VK866_00050 [Acidimicrobiales bacterium]|nr:hypothetical protein [Acidimicrobiales bacterium]
MFAGTGLPDATPLREAMLRDLVSARTMVELAMAVTDLLGLSAEAEMNHLDHGDLQAAFDEADVAGRLRAICADQLGIRAL